MIGHGEYPAAARHGCFSRIRNVIRPDGQAYGGLEGSGLCSFENHVKNLFFYYYFKMKLSVCLIVKNEERVLGRCLFCALQIADELIVVDTGSTDQSREIALEYTDLVYDHPWQDNFAEARSFAYSMASGDFLMWMDADDVIYPEDIQRIQKLKAELDEGTDVVFFIYRNYGGFGDFALRDRIHRREAHPVWKGTTHEAVVIQKTWKRVVRSDISITHKKEYVNNPELDLRIYRKLLKLGEELDDYSLAYCCREFSAHGLREDAEKVWNRLLQTNPAPANVSYALVCFSSLLLRRKEYQACIDMIELSIRSYHVPDTAFLYYRLGKCREGLGQREKAKECYLKAVDTPLRTETGILEFSHYNDYHPYLKLCALAWDQGDMQEAQRYNELAGKAFPKGRAWKINQESFLVQGASVQERPLVSVVMPGYLVWQYLEEAVRSILQQTWTELELILVVDTDCAKSRDILERFSDPRIRILYNDRNRGIAYSTNRGIRACKGKYIALMDADDVSLPDRLRAQVLWMEAHPQVDILGTGSEYINEKGEIIGRTQSLPFDPDWYKACLLIKNLEFCNSSAIFRSSFLERAGLTYREGYEGMQDYRFYMEASKSGNISCLTGIHHRWRIHQNSRTWQDMHRYTQERAKSYGRIRRDSLKLSGAQLTENEVRQLNELMPEQDRPIWNRKQRETACMLFQKLLHQATENGGIRQELLERILRDLSL